MTKNIWCFVIAFILIFIVLISGCEMIYPPTTYEETPIRISYEISYGYRVNSTGVGSYEITYWCDIPETILGITSYNLLYTQDYQVKTLANNTVIHWNISGKDEKTVELGINASIEATNYLVADLNGNDALTIAEITESYPEISKQYTRQQANETICFIDPYDPDIRQIAHAVFLHENTNNSFLVAKSLFSWLKQNIQYQVHPNERVVRPAAVTLQNKQGDCDDLSFLYISLCRTLDIPARFIRGYLLSENSNGAMLATPHAWVEVFVGNAGILSGWIPIECACCSTSIETDINQNFGIESAFHLRLFTDDGSNESLESSLTGISYVTHQQGTTITLESFAEIHNYQELESRKLIITEKNIRYYE
ncbi:MAG: transglutaminase domain-containing protein [Candidatus Thermoplasmatota archaeon]|nr:transglutaminase domain-containing protein [Candidatus Thermoplasmatota archaeon]